MANSRLTLRLTVPAQRDIAAITTWSVETFGQGAAQRYRALISLAFRELRADPGKPGSQPRPELLIAGARVYYLKFSKSRLPEPVHKPRHFILYRVTGNVLEIGRILHDSRDLARHVPPSYRTEDEL